MKEKLSPQKRNYYWLVSGTILYTIKETQDGEEMPGTITLNAMIVTAEKHINLKNLGKAQTSLQMQFHQKNPNPENVKIIDVVIHNLMIMGHFTESEFREAPEGTQLQKVQGSAVDEVLPK